MCSVKSELIFPREAWNKIAYFGQRTAVKGNLPILGKTAANGSQLGSLFLDTL